MINECIRAGRSVVVDNTNTTRAARAALIRQAGAAGFQVQTVFLTSQSAPRSAATIAPSRQTEKAPTTLLTVSPESQSTPCFVQPANGS